MDILKYYLYYFDSRFTGAPLIIRITVLVVTVLLLFYIFSVIRCFYMIRKRRKEERLYKKMEDRFGENLKSVLFSEKKLSGDEIARKLEFEEGGSLKNKEREPLTKLLVSVKDNSEEGQTLNEYNYSRVIDIFGLTGYWEGILRTNNLKKNMQALRTLEDIAKSGDGSIVTHKVQARNPHLRKHSKNSHMQFAAHDAFKFLDGDFDRNFNPLDEMRIRVALEERAKQNKLPLLIRWVHTSQNVAYKCFLIKEIGFFNQKESAGQLLELYQNERSYEVKAQVVETLGVLKYDDAIDVLIDSYGFNPLPVQTSIIGALGNMDSPKALSFLEQTYRDTQDGDLLTKVVENIYKLDKNKTVFYKLKQETMDDFHKSIFIYVEKVNEVAHH